MFKNRETPEENTDDTAPDLTSLIDDILGRKPAKDEALVESVEGAPAKPKREFKRVVLVRNTGGV